MGNDRPTNLFRSLDAQGCKAYYPKIKRNAEQHFKAAELLAGAGDHANSVAHLILGSEELVKSFVILLQAYDFPIKKIPNYDKLFSQHGGRHNLLKEFYSIYRFISDVIAWPSWNKGQSFLTNFGKALRYTITILETGLQNYEWWNSADEMKQHCFYFDHNSNGTFDPVTIDKKSFETTDSIVKKIREDLRLMVIIIERASPADLAELKDAFISSDMTGQIEETITRKKGR